MTTFSPLVAATRLAIALFIGLAAGLEREWSGHARGSDARFAGIRTFSMLGLIGGVSGVLAGEGLVSIGAALVFVAGALTVAGYVTATSRARATTDGTTETAALAIIALGVVAGLGATSIAAGAGALVVLLLREKDRVHWFVRKLDEPELRAGVQFAVLAVVVLPLLPVGPYFGALAIEPRSLWAIVLFFSALNFIAFIARRLTGPRASFAIIGALAGTVSSTALTLNFSRQSAADDAPSQSLALGVLAACTVLVPRVLLVTSVLNAHVAITLVRALLPMFLVGAAIVALMWRRDADARAESARVDDESPLRLLAAVRMAVFFQVAMLIIQAARRFQSDASLLASGALLGLTDVDALTVSLSRSSVPIATTDAARAIVVGIVANTVLKTTVALTLGRARFRREAAIGLTLLAIAGVTGLVFI